MLKSCYHQSKIQPEKLKFYPQTNPVTYSQCRLLTLWDQYEKSKLKLLISLPEGTLGLTIAVNKIIKIIKSSDFLTC